MMMPDCTFKLTSAANSTTVPPPCSAFRKDLEDDVPGILICLASLITVVQVQGILRRRNVIYWPR